MKIGRMTRAFAGVGGVMLLAGVTAGCGPTQAEKDLTARMEAAASKTDMAANKAEMAARSASEAAQRAEAAAQKAEAIFQKHMRK